MPPSHAASQRAPQISAQQQASINGAAVVQAYQEQEGVPNQQHQPQHNNHNNDSDDDEAQETNDDDYELMEGAIKSIAAAEAASAPRANGNSQPLVAAPQQADAADLSWYRDMIAMCVADRVITPSEDAILTQVRARHNITTLQHNQLLIELRLDPKQYENMKKDSDFLRECVVCIDASSDHIILPCYHLCLCGKCAQGMQQELKNNKKGSGQAQFCPKCRAEITIIHKIY